jgi:hypothetical protein
MKTIFTFLSLLLIFELHAQVNGYAKVSAISGTTLTISNRDETYGTFAAGQKVLVMQMQDNVIGSNTSNNSSFGNLSSIANAGVYEAAIVSSVSRSGGVLIGIALQSPLANIYNTGANSSIQVITFPTLGSPNYTTTSNITATPWNGSLGGVVAFQVTGILTLNNNISADTAGFRGGAQDAASSPYGTCNSTSFYNAVDPLYGNKGEGIYKVTNSNFTSGMGKVINGGGGGNTINSGGGGGGNYSAGGLGSIGWSCTLASTGGIGGIALNTYIGGNRIFMGGGGGSGEQNDGYNDHGGNGGGIIIIKAGTIKSVGTGPSVSISANGQVGGSVGNDGAGGGGAGGSIVLMVSNWTISPTKTLTISANGGNGGDVGDPSQHGGGGGGGQGAVLYSSTVPTTNITTNTKNGTGGLNSSGGSHAAGGSGSGNSGILPGVGISLPVKLVSFSAVLNNDHATLSWETADEVNVSHFEIERSTDGIIYTTPGKVTAINNSSTTQTYSFPDPQAINQVTYYRLKLVDVDNNYTYSKTVMVRASAPTSMEVNMYPNPARNATSLFIKSDLSGTATIRILNMQGAVMNVQYNQVMKGANTIVINNINNLSNGVYNVQVIMNNTNYLTRLLIQK